MASDDETSNTSDVENEEEEAEEEEKVWFGCKDMLMLGSCEPDGRRRRNGSGGRWFLGRILNPQAKWIQEWNRVFLLVCAAGLFVDPLFFYSLSISETCMCLFVDGWFAITVTALRCMTDALHVWNMWLQFKMAKLRHSSSSSHYNSIAGQDDDRGGGGEGCSTPTASAARSVAFRYLKAKKGFFFDLFVILPLPQVTFPLFPYHLCIFLRHSHHPRLPPRHHRHGYHHHLHC